MRLLVVGASGLIGGNLLKLAMESGHEILGTYALQPLPGLRHLDLGNPGEIENLFQDFQPNAVACCSAWSWVDGCEGDPARAFRENAEWPAHLAKLACAQRAQFLHFSSSYVFDGRKGPYDENAATGPLSVYGRTKLKGEHLIQEATHGTALIARTMGVYGEEFRRKNFVYQVVDILRAGKSMDIPSDQFGNASYARDVAAMVLFLLEKRASGIWNVAGPDPRLSRQDFALRIAEEYRLDAGLFRFVPTSELAQPAPRPLQGGLFIDRVMKISGYRPLSWQSIPV
jgi:dTDP-4-dehydrorhamnose reductase